MKGIIPKIIYTLKSKNLLRKNIVEIIRRIRQDIFIKKEYFHNTENLVVFLITPIVFKTGQEYMSGGLLSLDSIYKESKEIFAKDKKTQVILSTYPNSYLATKFSQFKSNTKIFRFQQVEEYFNITKSLIIHIPELLVENFLEHSKTSSFLTHNKDIVHINILNQNIKLMPKPSVIAELKKYCRKITQTTAHNKYCNKYFREYYNIPTHHFSVFSSPESYNPHKYVKRSRIIAYSKDIHPKKEAILKLLDTELDNNYMLVEIKDMKYQDYRNLIEKCMFTITFGEGLDFYFIESAFSGGVGISVFNDDFFPPELKNTPGIFSTYEELEQEIICFIKELTDKTNYHKSNIAQIDACANIYNYNVYKENIIDFYNERYTFK